METSTAHLSLWWMASEKERPKGQQGGVISVMKCNEVLCYLFRQQGGPSCLMVLWYKPHYMLQVPTALHEVLAS